MRVDIVTIFPEYLAPLDLSLIGKARSSGQIEINVYDLRTWTHDVHRTVDDSPYGGGPGMVMRPEPWGEALDELLPVLEETDDGFSRKLRETARQEIVQPPRRARVIVPTPAGELFTQALAHELATEEHLVLVCGRYEGIDQRVLDEAAQRARVSEISIGDYVLFGGEVAALVMLEAVVRLLPGVLGNADSLTEESHADGLLESPVYTKPATWRGREVPEVLRSGDHGRIARWRREESLRRTAERRPDLLGAAGSAGSAGDDGGRFPESGTDMAK